MSGVESGISGSMFKLKACLSTSFAERMLKASIRFVRTRNILLSPPNGYHGVRNTSNDLAIQISRAHETESIK